MPSRKSDEILGLLLSPFQLSEIGLGGVNQCLGLVHIEQIPDAAFLAGRDQFDGLLPGLDGLTNILDFGVIFAQIEIGRCDLRDQGLHHGLLVLLDGQEISARGLGGAAQLAEQVDFP